MQMQNVLRAGCGGGCVRAESKRECESAKTDESLLASFAFLRRFVVAAAIASAEWLQSCIRRTGLAARKVTALARA